MKKLIYVFFVFFLFACGGDSAPKFEGKWENPDSKSDGILTITKEGDTYTLSADKEKEVLEGKVENDTLIITANRGRVMKATLDEADKLHLNGTIADRVE